MASLGKAVLPDTFYFQTGSQAFLPVFLKLLELDLNFTWNHK